MTRYSEAASHPTTGTQALLRVLTAAGLAVGAYVHADLASVYDPVRNSISQGDLFRAEAAASALAAVLILLSGRRVVWAFAFVVAASGVGALLLYRYVNVGPIGPLPNMYEPLWYSKKTAAAAAEGLAAVTALIGLVRSMAAARAASRQPSGQYSPRRSVRW